MKKIKARWNSRCYETGVTIPKGEEMYYNYQTKKCYCMISSAAQAQEVADIQKNDDDGTAAYIRAQEDAYWDNQTGGYYSR